MTNRIIQVEQCQLEMLKLHIDGLGQVESTLLALSLNPDLFNEMDSFDIANTIKSIKNLLSYIKVDMEERIEFIEKKALPLNLPYKLYFVYDDGSKVNQGVYGSLECAEQAKKKYESEIGTRHSNGRILKTITILWGNGNEI